MLFQKDSNKIDKYKELKCLRFDLFNYVICLKKKDAELFKEKCNKIGYKVLTYEDALPQLKEIRENAFINTINLGERNKKKNIRISDEKNHIKEDKNYLNQKRNEKNNNKKELKFKNNSKYIVIEKNSEEYLKGKVIPINEIYKMIKFIHDKMKTKREKKIIPDKIKLSLDEMRTLKINLKKKIENLSFIQIKEIQQKYFKNNPENEINFDLNQLSQELLKRLQIDIEELEDLNKYNPNFINYKEELRRRIPDNQNEFKNFSQNNINHDFELSDSETDSDNDYMSDKSDFQKKFIDNLENDNNYENLIENFDIFDEESIKNFNENLNERFENLIKDEKVNLYLNSINNNKNNSEEKIIKDEKENNLYEKMKNENEQDNLYDIKNEKDNLYEIKNEKDNLYEIKNEKDNLYELKNEKDNLYEILIDDENDNTYFINEDLKDNFNKNLNENDNESINKNIINLNELDDNKNNFNNFPNKKFINNKNINKKLHYKNSNNNNINNNINNQLNENNVVCVSDDETISQE